MRQNSKTFRLIFKDIISGNHTEVTPAEELEPPTPPTDEEIYNVIKGNNAFYLNADPVDTYHEAQAMPRWTTEDFPVGKRWTIKNVSSGTFILGHNNGKSIRNGTLSMTVGDVAVAMAVSATEVVVMFNS